MRRRYRCQNLFSEGAWCSTDRALKIRSYIWRASWVKLPIS